MSSIYFNLWREHYYLPVMRRMIRDMIEKGLLPEIKEIDIV